MQTSRDDADIPPTARCTRCGSGSCEGCEPRTQLGVHPLAASLGPVTAKTPWRAALHTVTQPRAWVTDIERAGALRSLAFACVAEVIAAASFVPALTLGFAGLAGVGWAPRLSVLESVGFASLLALGLATLMLALHVLWALGLELPSRWLGRSATRWRASFCFALTSCGWDLVTSPAGVVWSIVTLGFREGLSNVKEAVSVPTVAIGHYLREVRGVPAARARWAIALSFVVPSVALMGLLLVVAIWLVRQLAG